MNKLIGRHCALAAEIKVKAHSALRMHTSDATKPRPGPCMVSAHAGPAI